MDMINYTNIYILNTLKLSINQMDKCKTNNIENNNNDDNDDVIDIDKQNESSNFGNAQSDEDIIKNSGFSMHDVADQLLATQANMLLNKNIMNGKIYIFNSKPKIIPIIKIIVVAYLQLVLTLTLHNKLLLLLYLTFFRPALKTIIVLLNYQNAYHK